ncbi:hypothetical protein X743_10150 [Mesorhizobium sp. LNHC252B00]|nr:hypothetical protein X743_10150 [Mesorhizobium sp. LNHC252B00]
MTALPIALGGTELIAWRLDQAVYAATRNSGEGAFQEAFALDTRLHPLVSK